MRLSPARLIDLIRREGVRGAVRRVRDRGRVDRLRATSVEAQYEIWERRFRGGASVPRAAASKPPIRFRVLVFGDDPAQARITRDSIREDADVPWSVATWNDADAGPAEEDLYWIGVGAGDRFARHALRRLADVLRAWPQGARPDLLYADEDGERGDGHRIPFLKPAWSPALSLTLPGAYPGVPTAVRATIAGPLRTAAAASAVPWVDLVLRVAEGARRIVHLPVPLVTRAPAPPAGDPLLGSPAERLAAVADALDRRAIAANPSLTAGSPDARAVVRLGLRPRPSDHLVSILLPTRDQPEMLQRALETIRLVPDRVRHELILLDHQTRDPAALELIRQADEDDAVRVLRIDGPFNYSRMINRCAEAAQGDLLLLFNNDVESSDALWLDPLLGAVDLPGTGAVGARLLYPNGVCQHGGIGLGIGTVAGHLGKGGPGSAAAAFVDDDVTREVGAVTGACLLVRADVFREVGGLDEQDLAVSFNDVDLCLRIRQAGHQIVYEPSRPLIHHESTSRDHRLDVREVRVMQDRWGAELANDPFLSPHQSRLSEEAQIRLWPLRARVAGGIPADPFSPREWTR